MTLSKLIMTSFITLILSSPALQASNTFGADDEYDQAFERGATPKTITIEQLQYFLSQNSYPIQGKKLSPPEKKLHNDYGREDEYEHSDSEECIIIHQQEKKEKPTPKRPIEPKKVTGRGSEDCVAVVSQEKRRKLNNAPAQTIYELDEDGAVVGANRETFAEESYKNGRLEKIRSDYNLWSKGILRNLRIDKYKMENPYADLSQYGEQLINFLTRDLSLSEAEIITAAKRSPFLQQMLMKGMAEGEVNEMRVTDMVPLYDGKDLEFFESRS